MKDPQSLALLLAGLAGAWALAQSVWNSGLKALEVTA